MMKVAVLTILAASATFAADEQQLALALRGQTDFDRVALSAAPQLREISACILSQASLVPVAPPEEQPVVHFRKGYCTLANAGITGDAAAYKDAAAEFDRAMEAWPARVAVLAKKKQALEPVSSGLRVLAQIARVKVGDTAPDVAEKELENAIDKHDCPASVMSPQLCEQVIGIGREWQGWMALRAGDVDAAARQFGTTPGWTPWVAGQQAFRQGQYAQAATDDQKAIADWDAARRQGAQPVLGRVAPPVDLSNAYAELGGAQLLAGNATAAIASLNQAVKESPGNSRAFYLRARAQEIAGHPDLAQAGYSLASRAAFANAKDLASGEAHLYRGILLYRRKLYSEAEDEFSSALNFEIPASMRADAAAWRRLAAVSSGSCEASRTALQEALSTVSPYFPKEEARTAIATCTATSQRP